MKLRNKKTGEVKDFKIIADYDDITSGWRLETTDGKVLYYDHIDEINQEWEDYKPKEPLIKDEKIRKAVRAWAEVVNAKTVAVVYSYESKTLITSKNGAIFQLPNYIEIEGADDFAANDFTIAELCGEEENAL